MFPTMTTTRWRVPADSFASLRRDMDQAFEELFGPASRNANELQTTLAVHETETAVTIDLDVPGFKQADLEIQFHDGRLWIKGERRAAEQAGKCWHNERRFGRFERSLRLAESVDPSGIEATLEDGVLTVRVPKKPEAQPVKIAITANGNATKCLSEEK